MPTEEEEKELFVDLCLKLADDEKWTTIQTAQLLSSLSTGHTDSRRFRELLEWNEIDAPAVEDALINLLTKESTSPSPRRKLEQGVSRSSSRHTDWASSAAYRAGNVYLKFKTRRYVSPPKKTLGAYLINRAAYLVALKAVVEKDSQDLVAAMAKGRLRYGLKSGPVNLPRTQDREKVLNALKESSAYGIESVERFERVLTKGRRKGSTQSGELSKAIAALLNEKNPNMLLEATMHLAVVASALRIGFSVHDTSLSSGQMETRLWNSELHIGIRLSKSGGVPEERYTSCMHGMGDSASGLEPDLRCQAYNNAAFDGQPTIEFLADAKRNAQADARGYRAASVKSALSYLDSNLEDSPIPFTLFFLRRGTKIGGKDPESIQSGAVEFPRHHHPIIGLGLLDGDFEGEILDSWLLAALDPEP